jgi:hypothetical protein
VWSTNLARPGLAFSLALASFLLASGTAAADDPSRLRITVVAILATDSNSHVDPKVNRIAQEVQKLEPTLTGFRMAKATAKSLSVADSATFSLVDDQQVTVAVEHGANQDKRVGLRVKLTGVGEITYETKCGKCFPIVTRYQTKDNERLIIAVMARPCTKK